MKTIRLNRWWDWQKMVESFMGLTNRIQNYGAVERLMLAMAKQWKMDHMPMSQHLVFHIWLVVGVQDLKNNSMIHLVQQTNVIQQWKG